MKIKSTLIFLLTLAFQTFSQNVAIELVDNNVLYRGYDNIVKLVVNNPEKGEIILSGINVEIIKKGDLEYMINVALGSSAELLVLSKRKSRVDTLYKKMYRVLDMPDPTIYWGRFASGSKASKNEKQLFAKYPADIPLNANHSIRKWEIIYGDKTISGIGSNLSRAKELIDSLPAGATVTIKCEVIMPSSLTKSIYGVWQVE